MDGGRASMKKDLPNPRDMLVLVKAVCGKH
jgi:hypothetical protein